MPERLPVPRLRRTHGKCQEFIGQNATFLNLPWHLKEEREKNKLEEKQEKLKSVEKKKERK